LRAGTRVAIDATIGDVRKMNLLPMFFAGAGISTSEVLVKTKTLDPPDECDLRLAVFLCGQRT
jgi:hypothetical protein